MIVLLCDISFHGHTHQELLCLMRTAVLYLTQQLLMFVWRHTFILKAIFIGFTLANFQFINKSGPRRTVIFNLPSKVEAPGDF